MVSGGWGSKKSSKGTKALIEAKGCEVVEYVDLFAKRKKKELVYHVINK